MRGGKQQLGGVPWPVRVAGALVALQGVAGLAAGVVMVAGADQVGRGTLGAAGYFGLFGLALLAVGAGLVAGRRWARTPAIVTQLLLLPFVYSLLGPSRQLALGIVAGVWVITTFLLLISERSRTWSMDLESADSS